IAELITKPGHINVDFADVRTVMSEMGYAMMGSGCASGDNRAEEAAEMAISSPLLEDIDLSGARGVLVNVTAGLDLGLEEFETVGSTVRAFASDNATVVVGTTFDPDMSDEIRVTVVATGIGMDKRPEVKIAKPMTQNPLFGQTSNLGQQEERLAKVVNEQGISPLEENKILDIPAFIRKQAN
ncbi:FtsZ family, partial [Gilliamella apicola SCGC AB-598-B02]